MSAEGDALDLVPAELRDTIPKLYATENEADPLVVVKWFTPWTSWTWYVLEFDGKDICFGYVVGHEAELGYFSLREISELQGPAGLRVERDLFFEPKPLSAVKARHTATP